jgi:hypothetical protein
VEFWVVYLIVKSESGFETKFIIYSIVICMITEKSVKCKISNKTEITDSVEEDDLIFVRDYYSCYFIQKESELPKLLAEIKGTRKVFCEYPNRKVNIKIDLDMKDEYFVADKTAITKAIIMDIQDRLKALAKIKFDFNDVYTVDSEDKVDEKQSRHITIRLQDACFKSRKDVKYLLEPISRKYSCIDKGLYGDTIIRVPYSDKEKENRRALPSSHKELDELTLFKMNLMSYVTAGQKKCIIELAPEDLAKKIVVKKAPRVCVSALLVELSKIFKLTFVKQYYKNGQLCLYYTDKCICCNEVHSDEKTRIIISCDLDNYFKAVFKCYKPDTASMSMYVDRKEGILGYSTKYLWNIYKDTMNIDNVCAVLKYLGCEGEFPIGFAKMEDIVVDKSIEVKHINKQYLAAGDIDIANYRTILIKSIERTNKTGAILDLFPNGVLPTGFTKVIILASNVGTLSSIHQRCKQDNIVGTCYYKKATAEQICESPIIITTINSCDKLLVDDKLIDLEEAIFWVDELNTSFQYVDSVTVAAKRATVYPIYEALLERCGKVIISDADLNNHSIDIVRSVRGTQKMQILINDWQQVGEDRMRIHVVNNHEAFLRRVGRAVKDGLRFVIMTDSKRMSYILYMRCIYNNWNIEDHDRFNEIAEKLEIQRVHMIKYIDMVTRYNECVDKVNDSRNKMIEIRDDYYSMGLRGKSDLVYCDVPHMNYIKVEKPMGLPQHKDIMVINSENNNTEEILGNLAHYIQDKRIVVMSPSVSIGTNVSFDRIQDAAGNVVDNKDKWFDLKFGYFTGKGPTAEVAQQQLHRVRQTKQQDHYVYIDTRNTYVNAKEASSMIVRKMTDEIIAKGEFKSDCVATRTGEAVVKTFVTKLIIYNRCKKYESNDHFKHVLLATASYRGHEIVLDNTIARVDNSSKMKRTETEFGVLTRQYRADDIIHCALLTTSGYDILRDKRDKTENECKQMEKYQFYKTYEIVGDDKLAISKFYTSDQKHKYFETVNRIKEYFGVIKNNMDAEARKLYNNQLASLKKLLTLIGLKDIWDLTTIKFKSNDMFNITQEEVDKIRGCFRNAGDIARLRGKYTKYNIIYMTGNIMQYLFGADIKINSNRKMVDNVRSYVNTAKITYNSAVIDILTLKSKNTTNERIQQLIGNSRFVLTNIHGRSGKRKDYIKDNYMFVDEKKDAIDGEDY